MNDTPSTTPLLREPAVAAALDTVRRAEVAVVEAKQAASHARAQLTEALFVACRPYRDGTRPLPQEELHRLYWEHTDLRQGEVAKAFGLTTGRLAELAGPREVDAPCGRCGRAARVLRTSRADRREVRCEPCGAEQRERERAEHEREVERLRAAREAWETNGLLDREFGSSGGPWRDPYLAPRR